MSSTHGSLTFRVAEERRPEVTMMILLWEVVVFPCSFSVPSLGISVTKLAGQI